MMGLRHTNSPARTLPPAVTAVPRGTYGAGQRARPGLSGAA